MAEGGGGSHADAVGAVGGVAHETIEDGPGGTEDSGGRAVGWLLEGQVGLLAFFGYIDGQLK